jgi:hypothetical protein
MFPVTNEALGLFSKNYRQTVEITFHGLDDDFKITEKDIMLGGLIVDRYSVSGKKIELGSACASELALTLDNRDGRFKGVKFEGAELFVRVGIKKYDARRWENATTQYVDLGYFTIDEPARALQTISLSALDRMVQFDKPVDWSNFAFPMTVKDILAQTCRLCNVPLGVDITGKPNWDYVIQSSPTDETTYREIIQWVAELTATCAFIDWEGKLSLSWYEPSTVRISPSERYSSDMLENDVVIGGVEIVDEDSHTFLAGDDTYVFRIEGNSLIQHDYEAVCAAIYGAVGGFTYRPYECITKPMPYLFPMDMVEYVDKDGVSHNTIVTNTTFTLNGNTVVMGQGETEASSGYAAANPLTKRESLIIRKALNNSIQSVLALNDLISNSLGVYSTMTTGDDGSTKYYMHDRPRIEESNTIYTMTANGFAYTNDGWKDGNPVWKYGMNKNGNAIFNQVCAYGLKVSSPDNSREVEITPESFRLSHKGKDKMFFDPDGNIAMDGYLTQYGAPYRAKIGLNDQGYGGFYVYNTSSKYQKPDGSIIPYCEIWTSEGGDTMIKGFNRLCLMTTNSSDPNDGNYSFLTGHQEHGYAKVAIHNYDLRWGSSIIVDATKVGDVRWRNDSVVYTNIETGYGWGVGVGGWYRIVVGDSGGRLYETWTADNSIGVTSDAKKKNSIDELPDKYTTLFDNLRPVRYKYNDGTSDRYHTGFIAQDVEQALTDSGIDPKDFAGFIRDEKGDCYLRYEEFIALAVKEVQTLKKKNDDLEKRVADLESKLEALSSKLGG